MNPFSSRSTSPLVMVLSSFLLLACSNAPKAPDWQLEAKGAMDRAVAAYLEGNSRIERAEWARARNQLSSTGRADLLAEAELLRCAARVASLEFEPCAGFEALRRDATDSQRAYADYLSGRLAPAQVALLPHSQQIAAGRTADDGKPLQGIDDPLSLIVAAGAMLQAGRANPAIINQAVDAASGQGWRRPLMAWLSLQAHRATLAGRSAEAEQFQRRIKLLQNEPLP